MSGLLGALPYLMWANKPKEERLRDAKALSNVPGGIGGAAQMYADTVEGGPSGLLGNVATNVTPWIVQSLLGKAAGGVARQVFAGEKAKTADREKLKTAQELAAAGADRQFIWDRTGWFQGADGKWRFEIPDNQSTWNAKEAKALEGTPARLGQLLSHGKVENAYDIDEPAFSNVSSYYTKGTGSYAPNETGGLRGFDIKAPNAEEARSVALHELQHAVQRREGFARGGNPEQFTWKYFMDEAQRLATLGVPEKEIEKRLLQMNIDPMSAYRRLAGEVEARNVQARMNMTPDERRLLPPWVTQDTPDAQQIIQGLLGQ